MIALTLYEFGCNLKEVQSRTRERRVADCRHAIHFLLKKCTNKSDKQIGFLTNRDRTTVINSQKVVENLIETNQKFKAKIERIIGTDTGE